MRRLTTISATATTPAGFTPADLFDRATQAVRVESPAKGALITCPADLLVRFDDAAAGADAQDDWHALPANSPLALESFEELHNFRCLAPGGAVTVIATLAW